MKLSDDWVIGFTEGEGCFGIRLSRGKTVATFCITQKEREILEEIKRFFRFGRVYYRLGIWRYYVLRYKDQLYLKDFFEGRLRSEKKRIQFERWKITLEKWGERFVEPSPSWTAKEEAVLKNLRGLGYTYKEIAKQIDRTPRAVESKNLSYVSASGVEA